MGYERTNCLQPFLLATAIACSILLFVIIYFPDGARLRLISESSVSDAQKPVEDQFLGGLFSSEFEEASCLSRYQIASYWKALHHKPSPYLLQRLRRYESLHKKCGPSTDHYRKATERLRANGSSNGDVEDCSYVVWIGKDGLGNRMLSLVSIFLYALLNNKVLLTDSPEDFTGVFCEPFPESSWSLPSDFPVGDFQNLENKTSQRLGRMIKEKHLVAAGRMITENIPLPAYVYLHLLYDYDDFDKSFYLGEYQDLLRKVPWLLVKSNLYFVPALFLNSQYDRELSQMFPERDTVFYHLGRYLFLPSNLVWGHITRYYKTYLANADERLGMQIRIFPLSPVPMEFLFGQILNCSLKEGLLPEIAPDDSSISPAIGAGVDKAKLKAVLVASLHRGPFEKLRDMYYEHPTTTGGTVVGVYQPSHEELQRTWIQSHNVKALAELYLLSFCDTLVTMAWSTYGYVAQGLGGLKPWNVMWYGEPRSYCIRGTSMEPCFFDDGVRKIIDTEAKVQYVRQCEVDGVGLKLYND